MTTAELESAVAELRAENEALRTQVHILQSEILWLKTNPNRVHNAAWYEKQDDP